MELDQEMTVEEIEASFDQEWVLINDPETDEFNRLVRGRVRYHSSDRDQIDQAVDRLGSKRIAIEYVGQPPQDMQFML